MFQTTNIRERRRNSRNISGSTSRWSAPMYDMRQQISVLVADDHPVVLHGLADMLSGEPDIQVVSLCPNGVVAAQAVKAFRPNVAILDMVMPQLDAVGVLRTIGAETKTNFIVLTASASSDEMQIALDAGAAAILFKDTSADDLIACVRSVAAGERWKSTTSERETMPRSAETATEAVPPRPLSPREFQVAKLVSRGLSNKEVGRLLSLSEGTIKIHLHKIYGKIGVPNRTALAALASSRDAAS